MTEKIAGIIGGMGPEATVDLMQRIIRLTPALDDADHIRCIVDNNPKVPSRIKAIIEGHGEDPGPAIADMGRRLEAFGADFLAIACNTAHYYYPRVKDAVNIPVIHIMEQVTRHILTQYPLEKKIGILGSPAVAMTRLYRDAFSPHGLEDIWPDSEDQAALLEVVIKGVKKGDTGDAVRKAYQKIADNLSGKGVRVAVVACTELSALDEALPIDTVDAADVLAREIIAAAGK
ncbi:MAG: amino acid racemase [Desulfobacteraceae bacterium]|mgnify:CR=1 FL=1|nr:MAG: amino acid racemase [Desulfobacteraceae bacterium]